LSRSDEDPYTLLLRADRPDEVEDVREVLEEVGIPYRSGLLAGDEPGVFFTVPDLRKMTFLRNLRGRNPWKYS